MVQNLQFEQLRIALMVRLNQVERHKIKIIKHRFQDKMIN